MNQKPKTYFSRRLAAFLIDFSIFYGTAFIMYNVIQLFHIYLSIEKLTLITALLYFPIVTVIFKASIGKMLLGLTIENNSKAHDSISIFLRELVYKQLTLILPISLVLELKKLEWLSPFFEMLCAFLMGLILFVIFLFIKRTWYDQLTKTSVVVNINFNRSLVKKGMFVLASICLVVFGIRTYLYLTTDSFNVLFVPKHSKRVIAPYVSFLENQKSAKDYIFELFDKNDIVILCERSHPEMTQYDFIYDLISDNRFIDNVGTVFSEIGSTTQQTNLSFLMETDSLTTNEFELQLVKFLRNFSHFPIWELTNQFEYYKRLYTLNQSLSADKRIQHYLTDIECNWDSIRNKQDYSAVKSSFYKRERILADNVINRFEEITSSGKTRKKCLVIMNYRHAFGFVESKEQKGDSWQTCASYIMKKYPDKVVNVMLNTVKASFGISMPDYPPFIMPVQMSPVDNGVWDNAFSEIGNRSLGFDFKNSPFGRTQFDLFFFPDWKKYKYQDIFDGFVFYKPLEEHNFSYGYRNIISGGFDKQIIDRAKRIEDDALDNNLAYWTHKVQMLKKQEITIDKKPYQLFESFFELVLGTILLLLGFIIGFFGFMRRRKNTKA